MNPNSDPPSRTSTPRSFTAQAASAEELLKSQTVGLVQLSDFRKRRAEVLEQKEREAQDQSLRRVREASDGSGSPNVDDPSGTSTPTTATPAQGQPPKKKKKKNAGKVKLTFGDDDDEESEALPSTTATSKTASPAPQAQPTSRESSIPPRRLTPNPTATLPPLKVLTKSSLRAEAAARDALRREFLELQEAVKAAEIAIPFVFYDGTNLPAGSVRMKKGEQVWLFLERCRKVGAELGVSGNSSTQAANGAGGLGAAAQAAAKKKSKKDSRKEWARIGVDDLMMVRGDVIVPHHYELYYFIANRVPNHSGSGPAILFDYSNSAPKPAPSTNSTATIITAADRVLSKENQIPVEELEGADMEPTFTKVVDRRWYEKNKHIFPASLWKEYEQGQEFEEKMAGPRRDGQGNAFFY